MKKTRKIIGIFLCLLLIFPLITACSGTFSYNTAALDNGKVGVQYAASVATVEDIEGVTYALKEGSALPAGLILSQNGNITGIPEAKGAAKTFTVVASASGYKSAEADFTITVAEGTLAFDAILPRVAIDAPYSAHFAVTGAVKSVTYTLKEGDELPTGLTFNNGTISGTPTVLGEKKTFSVTAASADCASVTAEFTLTVILPWLEYSGRTLTNGRVNEFYSADLASATGAPGITYTIKSGSAPPLGLTLSSSGFLSGTPTERVTRHQFTVVAAATGYTSDEAEFIMTVAQGVEVEDPGTITYNTKDIPTVYVDEPFYFAEAVKSANADNRANVSYALSPDSTLPGDLVILPNGGLRSEAGSPSVGTVTFKVVASASGCASVTTEFTLTVAPPKLIYTSTQIDMATVGDPYTYSVATATAPKNPGAVITYEVKTGTVMPAGLYMNSAGLVTGIPTKAAKRTNFRVVASAQGYTSVETEMYIKIQNAIETGITRFEAEFMDLTGIVGAGHSGAAREEGLIQAGYGASNGYFVGFTHCALKLTYKITSSVAASGLSFTISLDSEIGTIALNNSNFDIRINGKSITYAITVNGDESNEFSQFLPYRLSTNEALIQGENIIELEVLDNLLKEPQRTGGPGIDYIEFGNLGAAVLSWRPCRYNLG